MTPIDVPATLAGMVADAREADRIADSIREALARYGGVPRRVLLSVGKLADGLSELAAAFQAPTPSA